MMKSAPTPTKAVALPVVDREAFRLVSRDADGDSSDLLHFFDLDISIAEAEELLAAKFGRLDDPLDEEAFREAFQIVLRAVNACEVMIDVEEFGFFDDGVVVGPAGEVHCVAHDLSRSQAGRVNQVPDIARGRRATLQIVDPIFDVDPQPVEVHLFVHERIVRSFAPPANMFGKFHHLIDGFFAGGAADECRARVLQIVPQIRQSRFRAADPPSWEP